MVKCVLLRLYVGLQLTKQKYEMKDLEGGEIIIIIKENMSFSPDSTTKSWQGAFCIMVSLSVQGHCKNQGRLNT